MTSDIWTHSDSRTTPAPEGFGFWIIIALHTECPHRFCSQNTKSACSVSEFVDHYILRLKLNVSQISNKYGLSLHLASEAWAASGNEPSTGGIWCYFQVNRVINWFKWEDIHSVSAAESLGWCVAEKLHLVSEESNTALRNEKCFKIVFLVLLLL